MNNQEEQADIINSNTIREIEAIGNFQIEPLRETVNFDKGYTQLKLSNQQKWQISALIQSLPSLAATGMLEQAYVVKFPNGLPHSLTALKQGGYGTMIHDENGIFTGSASLYSAAPKAAFLGVFTAISIISGQYFLAQINSELSVMKMNIDKILEFLYGDKKAELMSEVSFVKYAYHNYGTIMEHKLQVEPTIVNLQNARKVAMKDIEFYIGDLDSLVNGRDSSDIVSLTERAFQIKESLQLSMQLYGISSILEIYFSQNHELEYIKYIDAEMLSYIDKCEKRMLSSFSILGRRIHEYKGTILKKVDKTAYEKMVGELVDSLNSGEESELRKSLRLSLWASSKSTEYYVKENGVIYLKVS